MLQVTRLVQVMAAFAGGTNGASPSSLAPSGRPQTPSTMQEIRPLPDTISHMAFALGGTGISASRDHGHSHSESFRRDGNNATIRGNKRAKDCPQTRIDESHRARRQLPDSQTPPTTLEAASVARRRNRRPPRLIPRRRRNLTSPKLTSLEACSRRPSMEPARQGETAWQGRDIARARQTQERPNSAISTRTDKSRQDASETSDCLLKCMCCSITPPRSVSVVPTRGPLRTPQTRPIPRHQNLLTETHKGEKHEDLLSVLQRPPVMSERRPIQDIA